LVLEVDFGFEPEAVPRTAKSNQTALQTGEFFEGKIRDRTSP